MVSPINRKSAVHSGDYVAALKITAEKAAEDLDNCDDPMLRSTLARTLSTVLTSLRLAEAAAPAKSSTGKTALELLREEASAG